MPSQELSQQRREVSSGLSFSWTNLCSQPSEWCKRSWRSISFLV